MKNEITLVKNYFTKEDSRFIKGIAIVLMVIHHLFAFPNRINKAPYISLFSINNVNIEFIIAQFGKICVCIFLFLSGYGMYYTLEKNNEIVINVKNRISKLFINYWAVFIIFIPIGFIFFKIPLNIVELVLNLLCIKSSYNGEWWFMTMYIVVVVFFVIMYKICSYLQEKKGMFYALIGVLFVFSLFVFRNNHIIIKGICMIICYEGAYLQGYLIAKYNLYNRLMYKITRINISRIFKCIISYFFIMVSIIIVNHLYIYDLLILFVFMILTPVFVFCIMNVKGKGIFINIFMVLGKHSTSIWLIHTFFCYYYFQKLIFIPKVSILIFFLLILLSLVVSIFIDNIIIQRISRIIN